MELIGFSLIAIGATGVALRRATRAPEAAESVIEFPSPRLDDAPRSAILAALDRCRLVPRKLVAPGRGTLALSLSRFVALHGLQLGIATSLAALFEAEGDEAPTAEGALGRRWAEFVICDAAGAPLCGIETAGRRADDLPDPVRRPAFARAGLPLVVLDAQAAWEQNRARLAEALGMAPDAAG